MQDQEIRKPSRHFKKLGKRIRKVQEIFPETEIQKALEAFRERVKAIERPKILKSQASYDLINPTLDRLFAEMMATGECYAKEAKAYNREVLAACNAATGELVEKLKENLISSRAIREELGKIQGSFTKAAYEILETDLKLMRLKKAAMEEERVREDKKLLESIEELL